MSGHGRETGPVVALGEMLVEVMRADRDAPLDIAGSFRGPFASGAPVIFARAVGMLGHRVRFAGTCSADPFGDLVVRSLVDADVDIRVRRVPGATTGTAFVAYRSNGERDFVFHGRGSAAAALAPDDIRPELLDGAAWLQLAGSALAMGESSREACYRAVELAAERSVPIGFDPNLRPELMSTEDARTLCAPVLRHARVLFPSAAEASLLTGIADADEACRALLAAPVELVVRTEGADGCTVFDASGTTHVPAVAVEETDPTGAGDVFAAAFVVAHLAGRSAVRAARFAVAAGALAVTVLGPAEGAPSRAEVERLLMEKEEGR